MVDSTILDVFVYPPETFLSPYDPSDFVQVFDGHIVLDKHGAAARLKANVLTCFDGIPSKTAEEIQQEIDWCKKMLARSSRGDAEGFYRWHWLLFDSLEIYFDLKRQPYHGPKKALRFMERCDPKGFQVYTCALKELSQASLAEWISYMENAVIR